MNDTNHPYLFGVEPRSVLSTSDGISRDRDGDEASATWKGASGIALAVAWLGRCSARGSVGWAGIAVAGRALTLDFLDILTLDQFLPFGRHGRPVGRVAEMRRRQSAAGACVLGDEFGDHESIFLISHTKRIFRHGKPRTRAPRNVLRGKPMSEGL